MAALLVLLGVLLLLIGVNELEPNATVHAISVAIATAEGFYVSGSVPQRANNPGDLELGDRGNGQIGPITVFPTVDAGWQALYNQVAMMLNGTSGVYTPQMSIAQIADSYTGGDNASAWAANVASKLGVSVDTPIGEVRVA